MWCLDTTDWREHGFIYNVNSAAELRRDSFDPAAPSDLYLFETGCGGDSTKLGRIGSTMRAQTRLTCSCGLRLRDGSAKSWTR